MVSGAIGRAVDISNWQGIVPVSWFEEIKALGYDRVIVGTGVHSITRAQMKAVREAGMILEIYIWLNWNDGVSDLEQQAKHIRDLIGNFPPHCVWLDVEQATDKPAEDVIKHILNALLIYQRSFHIGIYSSVSEWHKLTGNCHNFKNLPLWSAFYENDGGDIDNWGGPYGGWKRAEMRQWAGDVLLAGGRCDLNVYRK